MTHAPGDRVAHYRLVEKIGEGGMGVVWKAEDTRLDRPVAIKVLPDSFSGDRRRMSMFEREAKAIAAVNHPNIVTIHAIEEIGDIRLLVMELIPGESLDRLIPASGFPLDRFLDLSLAVTDALEAAHGCGVVHRDLKPSNILVGEGGLLKVLDFGLAKLQRPEHGAAQEKLRTTTLTQEGLVSGTIPYMSPEHVHGSAVDRRSDLFSLGVLLHEMATGRRPFRGESAAALISSILKDRPQSVDEINVSLPRRLGSIVLRCLEKDPDRRPRAARDVHDELLSLKTELARGAGAEGTRSVAVLPFADMSPAKDQDYFCEGIAEEIINTLSRLPGLNVASRTSAFRFKGATSDIREMGDALRVNTILEGSVRTAGDRLRVTAQLIDVSTGYHLWSERYDRELKDVFAVQDEIAASIGEALGETLEPTARTGKRPDPTAHVQAYDYYLRGRKHLLQFRKREQELALEMFRRAVEIDPEYAQAHAGIADACSYLHMWSGRSKVYAERADAASRRALELAPDSAEAHVARGLALSLDQRFEEAEEQLEKAIRLDPRLYEARYSYGRICYAKGDMKKTARLFEEAIEVEPEAYQAHTILLAVYRALGQEEKIRSAARRAIALIEKHLRLVPDDDRAISLGASALIESGEKERGLEWVRRSLELQPDDPMNLYTAACSYATAGEVEDALNCLERGADVGGMQKAWLLHDSDMDLLREHPRFKALIERIS